MKFMRCPICGKIVAVVNDTAVPLICCGKPMDELKANTTDAATEKHVPVVTCEENTVTVCVGSVEHPMLEEHFIQWIALETNLGTQMKYLTPGSKPCAQFVLQAGEEVVNCYEYCNLHGLWALN